MAKKSKRDDLGASNAHAIVDQTTDPGRQPRIVGWLVLILGGFSSWYWYKPLPDSVNQAAHATSPSSWATTKSGPNSLWTDETLFLPSTEPFEKSPEFRSELSNHQSEDANLVGNPNVTLVPWSEPQHDIREVLKTERVPMVPVAPNFRETAKTTPPPTWIPEHQLSNRFQEPLSLTSKWPDAGYVPPQKVQKEQRRAATQITTQIPKLLETGMKSIRTEDSDETSSESLKSNPHIQTSPIDGALQSSSQTSSQTTAPPARQPQFIRQPRPSN